MPVGTSLPDVRPALVRAEVARAWARAWACVGIAVLIGSCADAGGCPSGTTRACLSDGTTCTCAPDCSRNENCNVFSVSVGDASVQPCMTACTCAASLCLPNAWSAGEAVSYR